MSFNLTDSAMSIDTRRGFNTTGGAGFLIKLMGLAIFRFKTFLASNDF